MPIIDKLEEAIALLEKHKRIAYLPLTTLDIPHFDNASKIGGYPFLRHEEDWPICSNCKHHMQLFLQLDLSTLPERKRAGLLQFFYCTNSNPHCEDELNGFEPYSKNGLMRTIDAFGKSAKIEPSMEVILDEQRIVDWIPKADYPSEEVHEDLGIVFTDEVYFQLEEERLKETIGYDKLFGWPHWVQGEEYPNHPKTNKDMELLFQIASVDNLPYMFGDAGIGYLCESPDIPKEYAFTWACY